MSCISMPKLNGAKVLLLCTTDNMISQFLVPHIKDLINYGASVDCVASRTGYWFEELKDLGLNMIEINMCRSPINMTNFKAYKALCRLVRQEKYDIIYCQQPVGGMLGRMLGKKFKIPVIYTAHGFFFLKGNNKIKNVIYRTAEKILSKSTDVLITMNEEDSEAVKNWQVAHKYKISGIGVDVDKLLTEDFDKDKMRQSLGIRACDKVILSVSEVNKNKNYESMLKAIALLSKKMDNIKYISCGTGVWLYKMRQRAKQLGIEDKVNFLGYRKDVGKIMQISDVFFHQSFREGLPISVMEAMHFAMPVVASNIRGNADLIDDGKGGYLTQPKDIHSQANALEKILQDDTLKEQMGLYNKERVKPFYLDSVREELKKIYEDIGLIKK